MDRTSIFYTGLPKRGIRHRVASWLLRRLVSTSWKPSLDEQIDFLWLCAVEAQRQSEEYRTLPQHALTAEYWQRKAALYKAAYESLCKGNSP